MENDKEERAEHFRKIIELSKSGYGGILSNGNIVDRREHPEAIPFQKNSMFGNPEPLPVDPILENLEVPKDMPEEEVFEEPLIKVIPDVPSEYQNIKGLIIAGKKEDVVKKEEPKAELDIEAEMAKLEEERLKRIKSLNVILFHGKIADIVIPVKPLEPPKSKGGRPKHLTNEIRLKVNRPIEKLKPYDKPCVCKLKKLNCDSYLCLLKNQKP